MIAIKQLQAIGMDKIAQHENELTAYALQKLSQLPGICFYVSPDPNKAHERVSVIPFNIEGRFHSEVASILGYEYGIGVRSGCFCAHPLVGTILGIPREAIETFAAQFRNGEIPQTLGLVRASLGLHNTKDDVDVLYDALLEIIQRKNKFEYHLDKFGEYVPRGFEHEFAKTFNVDSVVKVPSSECIEDKGTKSQQASVETHHHKEPFFSRISSIFKLKSKKHHHNEKNS